MEIAFTAYITGFILYSLDMILQLQEAEADSLPNVLLVNLAALAWPGILMMRIFSKNV